VSGTDHVVLVCIVRQAFVSWSPVNVVVSAVGIGIHLWHYCIVLENVLLCSPPSWRLHYAFLPVCLTVCYRKIACITRNLWSRFEVKGHGHVT